MFLVYAITLTLLNALWALLNVLGLPGNWLIVASATLAWWMTGGIVDGSAAMFHWTVPVGLCGLAVVGEVMEFFLGAAGASKAGGSKRGAVGAIVGAIVGGITGTFVIPIPIVGSILGACIGAFCGALLLELTKGRGVMKAANVGRGAAVGRFWGTVAKLTIGGAMWAVAAVAAFWP